MTCRRNNLKDYAAWFLLLFLFSAAAIILHELGHHLFGIPSEVSLARNWPLVPVTAENKSTAIIGSIAGPAVNLLLGCLGILLYTLLERPRFDRLKTLAGFFALSNLSLVFAATAVNLLLDLASGNWVNDLQFASRLAGIHVLILPAIFIVLSAAAIRFFWVNMKIFKENPVTFIILLVTAGFGAGAVLSLLDTIFNIRYTLV